MTRTPPDHPGPPGPTGVVTDADPAPDDSVPDPGRIAAVWAAAVADSGYVPLAQAAVRALLTTLAASLLRRLHAPDDLAADEHAARTVGTELVAAHFTGTTVVQHTLTVLDAHLPGPAARRTALLAALAAGYAHALVERTRTQQEQLTASAFAASVEADRARWASDARFAAVFAGSALGIGVAAVDGRVLEANPAMCRLLDRPADQIVGRPIAGFAHPDDDPADHARILELLQGRTDHVRLDKTYLRGDGAEVHTDVGLFLVRDPAGTPQYLVGLVEDVDERLRLEERLRHQARHDPLTGLPNRLHFVERLQAVFGRPDTAVGMLFLDVDGFTAVNDGLGHAAGDELLRLMAQRLTAELGDGGQVLGGHLVARMGADEFAVLVAPSGGRSHLRRLAERVLAALRRPVQVGGQQLTVTVSIGAVERADAGAVAEWADLAGPRPAEHSPPAPAEDAVLDEPAAGMLRAADATLHWAKVDGRDRCAFFDARRHRADVDRFAMSSRMPDALARGEFIVYYQPLVRLEDQRLVGVEALVRWKREDGVVLGPGEFVPLAEESGLIVELGRRVLRETCAQAARWRRLAPHAPPMFVSVNLAARQVREPDIVEQVAEALAETGWPAEQLQLELTETDLMATAGDPLSALRAFADMGVRLAIDDFGTGYSNFAYLRELPVHVLKLAAPFVTGPGWLDGSHPPDEVDVEVVAHLVRLAHTLGLSVTAEHVETATQVRQLRSLGCDTGQGWYFAPASDADVISALMGGGGPVGQVV